MMLVLRGFLLALRHGPGRGFRPLFEDSMKDLPIFVTNRPFHKLPVVLRALVSHPIGFTISELPVFVMHGLNASIVMTFFANAFVPSEEIAIARLAFTEEGEVHVSHHLISDPRGSALVLTTEFLVLTNILRKQLILFEESGTVFHITFAAVALGDFESETFSPTTVG